VPSVLLVNRTRANAEALVSAFAEEQQLRLVTTSVTDARSRARAVAPSIALLELDVVVGLKLVRELVRDHPELKVFVYGSTDDEREVAAWAEAGATRIVMRTVSLTDLVRYVCEAARSDKPSGRAPALVHSAAGMTSVVRELSAAGAELTQREIDVLRLVAAGLSNREIADTLFLGLPTVKNHVQHLMRKLGVHRRSEAARYWHESQAAGVSG
jgi:DNA-binding NarL/FixJ family response regulator